MKKLLIASTMLVASIAATNAATISIGYQLTSDPASTGIVLQQQAVDPINGSLSTIFSVPTSYGPTWTADVFSTAGSTTHFTSSVTIDNSFIPFASDSFAIFITLSDITAPTGPVDFINDMTINNLPADWIANRTVYLNPSDLVFGQQIYLNPPTLYSTAGTETLLSQYNVTSAPYSITQFYGYQAEPIAPVPGPIVGAGLPGLMACAAALFALARRRRARCS